MVAPSSGQTLDPNEAVSLPPSCPLSQVIKSMVDASGIAAVCPPGICAWVNLSDDDASSAFATVMASDNSMAKAVAQALVASREGEVSQKAAM